jgi:hypothetical protein
MTTENLISTLKEILMRPDLRFTVLVLIGLSLSGCVPFVPII